MRLLNTKTLDLREFFDANVSSYAILSHMWGQCEVSLQDMLTSVRNESMKLGFEKIRKCCERAFDDGFEYA